MGSTHSGPGKRAEGSSLHSRNQGLGIFVAASRVEMHVDDKKTRGSKRGYTGPSPARHGNLGYISTTRQVCTAVSEGAWRSHWRSERIMHCSAIPETREKAAFGSSKARNCSGPLLHTSILKPIGLRCPLGLEMANQKISQLLGLRTSVCQSSASGP